jgi:elongation factor Ts
MSYRKLFVRNQQSFVKDQGEEDMSEISATLVKELRDQSGAAMMDCKKALVEAGGDKDKAMELLRQRGVAVANKKAGKEASEGLVVSSQAADYKSAVIVEINCQTDFVARNEEFVAMANEIAGVALKTKSKDPESLTKQKHGSATIQDFVVEKVAKTGENIVIRRLNYLEIDGSGIVGSYVHALGGKMGALLAIKADKEVNKEQLSGLARDIAMHIVSAKPQFIRREEVPADVAKKEKEIEMGRDDLKSKPDNIREKIVQGRVDKLLAERCLLEQPFVKDPNQTVSDLLKAKGKELGAELSPQKFVLYILGEAQ